MAFDGTSVFPKNQVDAGTLKYVSERGYGTPANRIRIIGWAIEAYLFLLVITTPKPVLIGVSILTAYLPLSVRKILI